LEDALRARLLRTAVPPPPAVWDAIQAELHPQPQRRGAVLLWLPWVTVAASLFAVGIGVGIWWAMHQQLAHQQLAHQQLAHQQLPHQQLPSDALAQEAPIPPPLMTTETPSGRIPNPAAPTAEATRPQGAAPAGRMTIPQWQEYAASTQAQHAGLSPPTPPGNAANVPSNGNNRNPQQTLLGASAPWVTAQATETQHATLRLQAYPLHIQNHAKAQGLASEWLLVRTHDLLAATPQLVTGAEAPPVLPLHIAKARAPQRGWTLGAGFAPELTSQQPDFAQAAPEPDMAAAAVRFLQLGDQNINAIQTPEAGLMQTEAHQNPVVKAGFSFSTGLEAGWQFADRWRLGLGVAYTRMNTFSNGNVVYEEVGSGERYTLLESRLDPSRITPGNMVMPETQPEFEIRQTLAYVGVPLKLYAQLGQGRTSLFVAAGVVPQVFVGGQLEAADINDRRFTSDNSIFEPWFLSGTVGAGVQYALSPQWILQVEPQVAAALTSITDPKQATTRPVNAGLGLRLLFAL
jgi:opacity protein-like surface antigen